MHCLRYSDINLNQLFIFTFTKLFRKKDISNVIEDCEFRVVRIIKSFILILEYL